MKPGNLWREREKQIEASRGALRRAGSSAPSTETEKIVVEKWCYFPELYKMIEIQDDAIENG